jgi:uncharacterized membrane protein SpoIIM required for sporulation
MVLIPHELAVGEVYFPPMLLAAALGFWLAWLTAQLLNRWRLSRFFAHPPLVLVALAVVYTVILGTFVVPA